MMASQVASCCSSLELLMRFAGFLQCGVVYDSYTFTNALLFSFT